MGGTAPDLLGRCPTARLASVPYHRISADTVIRGGLTALPTPGHTPGHPSPPTELPEGRVVILAADAINRTSEPAEGCPDAMAPQTAALSGARLAPLRRGRRRC